MGVKTYILMHTNLMEVSIKTGIPEDELKRRYLKAVDDNELVIIIHDDATGEFRYE